MSMQGKVVVITGANIGHRPRDRRRRGRAGGDDGAGLSQPGQGRAARRPRSSSGPGTTTSTSWRSTWPTWPRCARPPTTSSRAGTASTSSINNAGGTWCRAPGDRAGLRAHVRASITSGHFYLTGLLLPTASGQRPVAASSTCPRSATTSPSRACASTTSRARSATPAWRPTAALEAGQRPLHPGAGHVAWRAPASPPTRSTRARCAAASAWTATSPGLMGVGQQGHPPLRDQRRGRRQDLGLSGHVARRGRPHRPVLGAFASRAT